MPGLMRAAHTEESAEVEVIMQNMNKLKTLTQKIQGSLNRLEASGKAVQSAVRPIYGNTSRLQVTNSNIERINDAIEKIRRPLDKRGEEEPIIRGGIQKSGLQDYLASLDRTNQALAELKRSPVRTNKQMITELDNLVRFGVQQLEATFQETLRGEAVPVEPLHYITKGLSFPSISPENSSKLRQINSYMDSAKSGSDGGASSSRTSQVYSEVRGPYIAKTLENLATASVATVRKADPSALYRRGQSGIGTYSQSLEGIFTVEHDNICPIFAREQWSAVHTRTCQDAINQFAQTLRELHTHVKNNMATDCFLAYEIVDIVTNLSYRLESRNAELKQPFMDAARPIRETAKYSLQKLLEDTQSRANNIPTFPLDGGTVQVTYDTMARLQNMASPSFLQPLSSIFASVGDGGWRTSSGTPGSSGSGATSTPKNFDVGLNGRELFSSYLADTVDILLTTLEAKGRGLSKGKSAQGVFLCNNVCVIDRHIATSSDLSKLLSENTRARIDAWRKKASTFYTDAWREPCVILQDVQYTNRSSQGNAGGGGGAGTGRPASGSVSGVDSAAFVKGLSGKDREQIKDKFKHFNTIFDELVARHRTFRMEDETKRLLVREVQALIEPLYDRFWDRYHEIDKGKGKHVRYDKGQLHAILNSLAS